MEKKQPSTEEDDTVKPDWDIKAVELLIIATVMIFMFMAAIAISHYGPQPGLTP